MQTVDIGGKQIQNIPSPNTLGKQLLEKLDMVLPVVLRFQAVNVHTKKKLPSERILTYYQNVNRIIPALNIGKIRYIDLYEKMLQRPLIQPEGSKIRAVAKNRTKKEINR